MKPNYRAALDLALDSAKAHGEESDPDHEVGDLLELIEALWRHLPEREKMIALLEYGDGREAWDTAIRKALDADAPDTIDATGPTVRVRRRR